ncbi:MAG: rhomboid family intramembrane serine protease [Candidatus Helarchaeota archaeon]
MGLFKNVPYFTIIILILLIVFYTLKQYFGPIYPNFSWGLISFIDFVHGEYWGIFFYAFMHYTWEHLVFNCVQIAIFGFIIEQQINLKKLLILFFSSILLGGILCLILVGLLNPEWVFMGASGFANSFLGCAWMLSIISKRRNPMSNNYTNTRSFYFYLIASILFPTFPIFNIFNLPGNITYELLIYGVILAHYLCLSFGLVYGFIFCKK